MRELLDIKFRKDKDVVTIVIQEDMARDHIMDYVVRELEPFPIGYTLKKQKIFSIGGSKENIAKGKVFIEEQSDRNYEQAVKYFNTLVEEYKNNGYVEEPSLVEKVSNKISSFRDKIFPKTEQNEQKKNELK